MTVTTWDARDLPILRVIVEMCDGGAPFVGIEDIVERTELDVETVKTGLWALAKEQPPFFEYINMPGLYGSDIGGIRNPTGHSRRTVGTWPKPEDRVAEMIAMLWDAAEREPDPHQKSILRKAAEYVAGVPRDVAVGFLIAVATAKGG